MLNDSAVVTEMMQHDTWVDTLIYAPFSKTSCYEVRSTLVR